MTQNKPLVLSCKQYDETIAIERESSDVTYHELLDMFLRLSTAMGFSDITILRAITNKITLEDDTDAKTF